MSNDSFSTNARDTTATEKTVTSISDAPAMPPTSSLTLILAATPSLGIGSGGGLPWPQLKKEMGYFARVTKRTSTGKINAVLMGRKTWESIPPKFRPLKDRLNVVITGNVKGFSQKLEKTSDPEGPMVCSGVMDALTQLSSHDRLDKIFVIGGASIYQTALELPQTKRVLLTKIHKDYECDTFFPINLEQTTFWRNASKKEVADFTGEEISEGGVEDQGVNFEFCMYERD